MRWFLPWMLAAVTAAAAGSAMATVSPAWRGSERGPSSLLPLVLLHDGQDERGWKGGGQGKGARERLRVKGRAAWDQQILAGRGGRGNK